MKVEAGKRFVHQQEVLAAQDLLDDGASLALAARQLSGVQIELVFQPELIQQRHDLVAGSPGVLFLLAGAQHEVSEHGAMLEERVTLRDHADLAGPDRAIEAVDGYSARGGLVQSRNNAEERGLAAAGRAEDAHHLALDLPGHNDVAHLAR